MTDNAAVDMGAYLQNGEFPATPKQPEPQGFQVQTIPTVKPDTGAPAFGTGEQEQGIRPDKWEKFVGKVKQTSDSSPIGFIPGQEGSLSRMLEENLATGVQRNAGINQLTPEEANQQYPGLTSPFKEPIYPEVAKLRWEESQKKKRLAEWVSRGPDTGFGFDLAAGSTGAIDPLNLGLNIATSGLSKAAGILPTVRNMFLQNLGLNAAAEIPNYIQSAREGENVSFSESAKQVAGSAILGTAIGKLIHIGSEKIASLSEASRERNLKVAVAQHESGSRVDLAPQGGEALLRSSGAIQPGTGVDPYVFSDLSHPSERSYYAGATADTGEHVPLGDFGPGVYGTDHSQVVNNLASQPEGVLTGQVHEFKVGENSKFLDLETSSTSEEGASFIKELETKTGIALDLPEGATIKEALNELSHLSSLEGNKAQTLELAQEVAKEKGFDGYRYTDAGALGADNRVLMFPGAEGQHIGSVDANPETTPQMTPQELQDHVDQAGSPETSALADSDIDQTLAKQKSVTPADPKIMDPVIQQQAQYAQKVLKELSATDPELKAELESLNHDRAKDAQVKKTTEILADCLTKGVT